MDKHPKNHFNYCPRCAAKGEFNETSYSFKCHNCGFHFFLNSAAAVTALIFNEKGELLLSRRGVEPSKGELDLPGGFVDPMESAEHALLREVKEELDLNPESVTYFGSFPNEYHFSGTTVYTVDLVFKCEISDFGPLVFRDDIIGLEFKRPSEINLAEIPFRSVQNIIKKIQQDEE